MVGGVVSAFSADCFVPVDDADSGACPPSQAKPASIASASATARFISPSPGLRLLVNVDVSVPLEPNNEVFEELSPSSWSKSLCDLASNLLERRHAPVSLELVPVSLEEGAQLSLRRRTRCAHLLISQPLDEKGSLQISDLLANPRTVRQALTARFGDQQPPVLAHERQLLVAMRRVELLAELRREQAQLLSDLLVDGMAR